MVALILKCLFLGSVYFAFRGKIMNSRSNVDLLFQIKYFASKKLQDVAMSCDIHT